MENNIEIDDYSILNDAIRHLILFLRTMEIRLIDVREKLQIELDKLRLMSNNDIMKLRRNLFGKINYINFTNPYYVRIFDSEDYISCIFNILSITTVDLFDPKKSFMLDLVNREKSFPQNKIMKTLLYVLLYQSWIDYLMLRRNNNSRFFPPRGA